MSAFSATAVALMEAALAADTAEAAGRVFYRALEPYGILASYVRAYRSGRGHPTTVYSRISPPGWEDIYEKEGFHDVNYLVREVHRRSEPFPWSDMSLINDKERRLARLLVDLGFPDGLAVPCHGAGGYLGVVSLAFSGLHELSPMERSAIELASLALHAHMRKLKGSGGDGDLPELSPRERDCIGFVAEGKTDGEISEILTVSRTTVITHVQNARLKLGAATRAEAVAKCISFGLI